MSHSSRLLSAAAAMVAILALGASPLLAAQKGIVTGRVMLDGKPVPGLHLRLVQDLPMDRTPGKSGGGGGTKVIGRAITDADGRFTFNDIEPGTYRVEGGSRSVGWIYVDVKVEPGKTADLGDQVLSKLD